MGRRARVHFPGALYHVILFGRGDGCFRDTSDWQVWQEIVGRAVDLCAARVHAVCCLPSRVHLAVEIGNVPLGRFVQRLCGPYSHYVHRRDGVTGAVFRSRYDAILVDRAVYLLHLVLHVHLRPVALGLVADPAEHPWSSHSAYLGRTSIRWLTTENVMDDLAVRGSSATNAYRAFVAKGESAEIANRLEHGSSSQPKLVGNLAALDWQERRSAHARTPSLQEIADAVSIRLSVSCDEMASASHRRQASLARALTTWHAVRCGAGTLADVARLFRRNPSTLLKAVDGYRRSRPDLFGEPTERLLGSAYAVGRDSRHIGHGRSKRPADRGEEEEAGGADETTAARRHWDASLFS